ncbi:MAG: DUF3106 domain-containing protein [Rhodocyclaceae bacterium]
MAEGRFAAIAFALAVAGAAQAEVLPEIRPPDWGGLTPRQKQVLTPLQSEWDSLPDARRKNWLGIANGYPRMSVEEQRRVQARMREWAELTPDQRRKARERYRSLQSVPPNQREALKHRWEEKVNPPEKERKLPPDSENLPASLPQSGSHGTDTNRPAKEAGPADSVLPGQPAASNPVLPANGAAVKGGSAAPKPLVAPSIEEKAPSPSH